MNKCKFCAQAENLGDTISGAISDTVEKGGSLAYAAYAAIAAWIGGLVISEATLLKAFFISLGVLIGSVFSDFFKKHKWLTIFVIVGTAALFLFKVLEDLDDEEDF